jgi:hypothetical protein
VISGQAICGGMDVSCPLRNAVKRMDGRQNTPGGNPSPCIRACLLSTLCVLVSRGTLRAALRTTCGATCVRPRCMPSGPRVLSPRTRALGVPCRTPDAQPTGSPNGARLRCASRAQQNPSAACVRRPVRYVHGSRPSASVLLRGLAGGLVACVHRNRAGACTHAHAHRAYAVTGFRPCKLNSACNQVFMRSGIECPPAFVDCGQLFRQSATHRAARSPPNRAGYLGSRGGTECASVNANAGDEPRGNPVGSELQSSP